MAGKRFTTNGTMTVIADDGEKFPATVSLSGDATGDAWRGNILVKAEIEGEEMTVISGRFQLERSGGASSSIGIPGKSGGGMSGMGTAGNPGRQE